MRDRKGFVGIPVIVAILVIAAVGGYLAFSRSGGKLEIRQPGSTQEGNPQATPTASEDALNPAPAPQNGTPPAPGGRGSEEHAAPTPQSGKRNPPQQVGLFGQLCEGTGSSKLDTFPINVGDIEFIQPMGRVQDSHVTPTDHQYVVPTGTKGGSLITDNPRKYEIRAPADGSIIQIELFRQPIEEQYRKDPYQDNYLVLFEHSCDFYTRLIHIDTLSERILNSFAYKNPESQHPYATTRIPVKRGEVIGTVGPHSFDFQIMDRGVRNTNLISPDNIDFFSSYTVDTFDYLTEPLRGALLKKNLTTAPPLGGKIGYDVDGRLAGNWFLVGRSKERENYWTNNLAVVYDHLDPTQIRISFGNFAGYPKAFGVRGNAPDPASVSKASGAVKYELMAFDYYIGSAVWDALHYAEGIRAANTSELRGTVLFELIEDRKLKAEIFPGKAASAVAGFTAAAKLYER